jgi:hypothetical protein
MTTTSGSAAPASGSVVPAATATSRHSAVVRVTHWITTLCFLALLVSGVEILVSHPRFYWAETGNVLTPPLFTLPIHSAGAGIMHVPWETKQLEQINRGVMLFLPGQTARIHAQVLARTISEPPAPHR